MVKNDHTRRRVNHILGPRKYKDISYQVCTFRILQRYKSNYHYLTTEKNVRVKMTMPPSWKHHIILLQIKQLPNI